jgi:hypothetical protein
MRTVLTILLAMVFVPLFVVAFLTHSVVGYPFDSTAVVGTFEKSDTYGSLLKLIDIGIQESIKKANSASDAQVAEKLGNGLKATLMDAIPEKTFYEMLTATHSGFASFLDGGQDTAQVDLTNAKQKIRAFFDKIIAEAAAAGSEESQVQHARLELEDGLRVIPDKFNMTLLLAKGNADTAELKKMQEGIATAKTVRVVVMAIMAIVFGLILLVAKSSTKRLLTTAGICLMLGGILYFPIMAVSSGLLSTAVNDDLKKNNISIQSASEADQEGAKLGSKLALTAVENVIGRCNLLVGLLTLAGTGMFVLGLMRKPETPAPVEAPAETPAMQQV